MQKYMQINQASQNGKNPTFSLPKCQTWTFYFWRVSDVTKLCVYITWPPKMTTDRIFIKHKPLTSEEWCVKCMYISITYTTGTKNENMNVVRKKKRLQEIVNFSKKWHHTHTFTWPRRQRRRRRLDWRWPKEKFVSIQKILGMREGIASITIRTGIGNHFFHTRSQFLASS